MMIGAKIFKSPWVWLGIAAIIIVALAWPKKSLAESLKPPAGATQQPSSDYDVRPLIDKIYNKIKGVNFLYYPDTINILADLQPEYLITGYNYWQNKYAGAMNEDSLTQALMNELHGGMYDPAISALTDLGLV